MKSLLLTVDIGTGFSCGAHFLLLFSSHLHSLEFSWGSGEEGAMQYSILRAQIPRNLATTRQAECYRIISFEVRPKTLFLSIIHFITLGNT